MRALFCPWSSHIQALESLHGIVRLGLCAALCLLRSKPIFLTDGVLSEPAFLIGVLDVCDGDCETD